MDDEQYELDWGNIAAFFVVVSIIVGIVFGIWTFYINPVQEPQKIIETNITEQPEKLVTDSNDKDNYLLDSKYVTQRTAIKIEE